MSQQSVQHRPLAAEMQRQLAGTSTQNLQSSASITPRSRRDCCAFIFESYLLRLLTAGNI
eukprot:scaffold654715_cov70-Prasinocladus_malaysianus.AAC.1